MLGFWTLSALSFAAWAGTSNGASETTAPALKPDAQDVAVPSRRYDILALDLDLALDFPKRRIGGTATYTVQQLSDGEFVLDQVALNIQDVTVDGEAAAWRTPGDRLVVEMPERLVRKGQAVVAITYDAQPRTGLHFRDTGKGSPDDYPEVWTQGQKNDNRYWFPAWDHPNDRFEYTGRVTGPPGWKMHTNSGVNLPSYLVMMAGGPYKELGDKRNRIWVGPNASPKGMQDVWAPVPDMMEHFEERTGVPYPWDGYLQVFVQRFMYGGMENTSATINTNTVITPERVVATRTFVQSLIAHELAHQWFGDWLTCRSWRDLWLNEGFATFFQDDWLARRDGEERGAFEALQNFAWSKNERALAGRFFHGEGAAANHNVYAKGSSVLQMLKVMLGEETFWDGIRIYTRGNPKSLVRTIDLQSAMEQASGAELDWFFQQWVELPYVPKLTVQERYSDGELTITVTQDVSDQRPRYTIPFSVEVGGADGATLHTGLLDDAKTQLRIPLESAPTYVAFDPKAGILHTLTHEQDPEAWAAQLGSQHPAAVFRALRALAETDHHEPVLNVLQDRERHFLIRAEAAQTLGKQRRMAELRAFSADKHDEVRRSVVRALGQGLNATDLPLLERRLRSDANADVRIAALQAISQLSKKRGVQMARRSLGHRDGTMVATAAGILGGHGELEDVGRLISFEVRKRARNAGFRAAARIIQRADEGASQDAAMGRMTTVLIGLLDDLDVRTRQTAVSLLGSVGDRTAIPHLEAFRRVETVQGLSEQARKSVQSIRGRQDKAEPLAEENAHEARMKALEERIDELEDKVKAYEAKQ